MTSEEVFRYRTAITFLLLPGVIDAFADVLYEAFSYRKFSLVNTAFACTLLVEFWQKGSMMSI